MKSLALVAVIAVSTMLGACGKQQADSPTKTGAGAMPSNATASAPPAQPDRDAPPAATPATHAQAPQGETSGAATARDTPAAGPAKDLTAAEESNSMPKPGQTDNHFTPSIDGAAKGSQQSPGATSPAQPTQAPAPTK